MAFSNKTEFSAHFNMTFSYNNTDSSNVSFGSNISNVAEEFVPLPDIRQPVYMVVLYSVAYGLVFLFALFGNFIVIVVVYRHRRMHTVTNSFIVNLAVADILIALFCIPVTLLQSLFNGWRYGAVMCKATPYLQGVSVCVSVNTLAAIAADRYFAICYSLQKKVTWTVAKIMILLIWVVSLGIISPWLVFYQRTEIHYGTQLFYFCEEKWPTEDGRRIYFLVIFVFCYTIPLILIIVCYLLIAIRVWNRNAPGIFRYSCVIQKSKVKVVKMLVVVVVVFALSWLPLYILFLIIFYYPPPEDSDLTTLIYNKLLPVAQWLALSNSGMNPVIYCFFSKTIRKRTADMLTCSQSQEQTSRPYTGGNFSSTRYVSVDYTCSNGQITLRLQKRPNGRIGDYNSSTIYD